jgi:hypothetical protein
MCRDRGMYKTTIVRCEGVEIDSKKLYKQIRMVPETYMNIDDKDEG